MKKAQFRIEFVGETDMQGDENAVDAKSRIEARFIPYLYKDKEFRVADVHSVVHTYDEPDKKQSIDDLIAENKT